MNGLSIENAKPYARRSVGSSFRPLVNALSETPVCVSPPVFRVGFIGRYSRCSATATLPKARWACSLRFRHSVRERNLPGGSSKSVRRSLAPSVFRPCPTKRPLVTSLPKYLHGDSACGWRCRPLRSRHYSEYFFSEILQIAALLGVSPEQVLRNSLAGGPPVSDSAAFARGVRRSVPSWNPSGQWSRELRQRHHRRRAASSPVGRVLSASADITRRN